LISADHFFNQLAWHNTLSHSAPLKFKKPPLPLGRTVIFGRASIK
jgi:hypothetical protein